MKRRCPILLQTDATGSGAVSLAMVMSAWGLRLTIGQLRSECCSARDGSRPDIMLKVARAHGFEAEELEIRDPKDLLGHTLPLILFWEFNRFVVLVGRSHRGWIVHDPATGRHLLDDQAFSDGFTGLVLRMKPGPDFRRGGRIRPPIEILLLFVRSVWADCLYIALIGLVLVPCDLLTVALTKVFLDGFFTEGYVEWGVPVVAVSFLSILTLLFLGALRISSVADAGYRMGLKNVGSFLRKLFSLPAQFFVSGFPGEISSRVLAVDRADAFIMGKFALTVTDLLGLAFFGTLLFFFDVTLAAVAVSDAVLTLVLLVWLFRLQIDDKRTAEVTDGQSHGLVTSAFTSIESLKATASEEDTLDLWVSKFNRSMRLHYGRLPFKALLRTLPPAASALTIATVMALGGFRILDGSLTIGSFVIFQLLLSFFFSPLTSFTAMLDDMQTTDAGLRRVQDILDYSRNAATLPPAGENVPSETRLAGRVEFRDLSFSYSPATEPILRNISFTVEPGRSVAIVGASGSGKSTLAHILAGQYAPTAGEMLIDGRPRRNWTRWQLRRDFAMVDQNITFFPGTIRENLALFDGSVPLADIQRAAEDACIHDTIVRRAGGYESSLSGEKCGFSGGELQRMEIARALVTDPRILLLDEATSALDTMTEKTVMENIGRRGTTRVIIAHRLSTIRDADEILVLSHGVIAERGTHDSLMALDGLYAALSREKGE